MIVYNVTVKVDVDSHEDWIKWMKETHVPEVMNTEMFDSYRMCRILGQDESDGVTFSVQYVSKTLDNYHRYVHIHGPELQKRHKAEWDGKYVSFRTVMEVI